MGLRVPVLVATKDSSSVQYVDVGSNLDCSARAMEEGRFRLDLSLERSSLYTASPERKSLDWSPGDPPLSAQPIIRQFRVSLNMLVRDGQTVQATAASDPVSGRVLKIEVTLSVLK
jgi:Flp pilus assembly secretin CpaC